MTRVGACVGVTRLWRWARGSWIFTNGLDTGIAKVIGDTLQNHHDKKVAPVTPRRRRTAWQRAADNIGHRQHQPQSNIQRTADAVAKLSLPMCDHPAVRAARPALPHPRGTLRRQL